jgi:hypothetical protein
MTAGEALKAAGEIQPSERLHRYETICGPRGGCDQQPLTDDPGRWSWWPDCLTGYDDYGKAVNQISEFARAH